MKCYQIDDLAKIVTKLNISIGILTLPPEYAKNTAELLAVNGVRGMLNFTTVPLNMPANVYLEEFDMITSLEKVAYFVKKQEEEKKSFT